MTTETKETAVSERETALDRIAAQLRTELRRDTGAIVVRGKLLIEARELYADEHGDWQDWVVKRSGLSVRSAQNYCAAAEYVARKSATVADFANLSPTLLYDLAAGHYSEQEEAAILAATTEGQRVNTARAIEICDALDGDDDGDDAGEGGAGPTISEAPPITGAEPVAADDPATP